MAETVTLTDHDQIRDWAAARMGFPAVVDVSPAGGTQPMLRIVFDQMALNAGENQYTDRIGGLDLASWEDWFAEFDGQNFGLLVEDERPGVLDDYYEFVPRDGNQRD